MDGNHYVAVLQLNGHIVHALVVTAIETIGDPEERRQQRDSTAGLRVYRLKRGMAGSGHGFAVIAAEQGYQLAFRVGKARKIGVGDQVIRMLMVTAVADEMPDIVQICGGLEQLAKL